MTTLRFGLLLSLSLSVTSSMGCGLEEPLAETEQLAADTAEAGAVALAPSGIPQPHPCTVAPPNASLTLGAGMPEVSTTSPSTSYSTSGCGRYIVDISVVPGASMPGPGYTAAFSVYGKSSEANGNIVLGITQAQCPLLVEETRIYKKAAGSLALNTLGGGKRIGSWVPAGEFLPAHCELRPDSAYKPVATQVPPASGTDLYRVTVSTKLGTAYRLVTAGAVHLPIL